MRITKRGLQLGLGVLWLLDGALQLQPVAGDVHQDLRHADNCSGGAQASPASCIPWVSVAATASSAAIRWHST